MRMGLGSLQYLVPSCWNCLERIRKCGFDRGGVTLLVELSLGAGFEVSFTLPVLLFQKAGVQFPALT